MAMAFNCSDKQLPLMYLALVKEASIKLKRAYSEFYFCMCFIHKPNMLNMKTNNAHTKLLYKGYDSRSHAESRARNRLPACANSCSSSGPVLFWFCAMKSSRIFLRTGFAPLSHSCKMFITREIDVCCFADPISGALFLPQNRFQLKRKAPSVSHCWVHFKRQPYMPTRPTVLCVFIFDVVVVKLLHRHFDAKWFQVFYWLKWTNEKIAL